MVREEKSYRAIFKTIVLFAGVKIGVVLVNLLKNKIIALFVGTTGIGFLGLLSSVLSLATSVSDLGISKSGVRTISISSVSGNQTKLGKDIKSFKLLLLLLSFFFSLFLYLLAFPISKFILSDENLESYVKLLSLAVFFSSLANGFLAIIQGVRNHLYLAKSTTLGAILGFLASVPLFYYLREKGIVYSFIISGVVAFFFAWVYYQKLSIKTYNIKFEEFIGQSKNNIRLGVSMMMVTFFSGLSEFLLRSYLIKNGGIQYLGLFQTAYTIVVGYFGIIFTAITTDYFPRISAIANCNIQLKDELNKQALLTILVISPLLMLLYVFMPKVIALLYTKDFLESIRFIKYSLFGIILQACSQPLGMILLAKNNSKIFIISVLGFQTFFLLNYIILYNLYGLDGLGMAFSINMLTHFIVLQLVMHKLYSITYTKQFYRYFLLILFHTFLGFWAFHCNFKLLQYLLLIASFFVSITILKKLLNFGSIKKAIIDKLKK